LTPLDGINRETSREIQEKVHESFPWFKKFALALGAREEHLSDAEFRVQRIFAVLIQSSSSFKFSPGYQYFGFIGYLIAMLFGVKGGLGLIFAEALGSYICRGFISIVAFTKHLNDLKANEDHYSELIRIFKRFEMGVFKKLQSSGIDVFDVVNDWERTLFAEEHAPWNLLLIWDYVLFHMHEYRSFIRFLSLAHFRQMQMNGASFESYESLKNQKWNGMKIIDDVEELMEKDKKSPYSIFFQIACPCLHFLHK
jgi:hypothetical protein